jgi:hypothetical protein
MKDSFSDMIQSQCPRSRGLSRPFAYFYLEKVTSSFWRGEDTRGMRITLKMKGRVIRPEAGDLIF